LEWDEIRGVKGMMKYLFTLLKEKEGLFKRDAFFANKIRLNPRVETSISEKDLSLKKDRQENGLGWLRKCAHKHIRPCFKNQVILNNGLVICCAMNTY